MESERSCQTCHRACCYKGEQPKNVSFSSDTASSQTSPGNSTPAGSRAFSYAAISPAESARTDLEDGA